MFLFGEQQPIGNIRIYMYILQLVWWISSKNVGLEASYGCVKAANMTPRDISEQLFDAGFDCM